MTDNKYPPRLWVRIGALKELDPPLHPMVSVDAYVNNDDIERMADGSLTHPVNGEYISCIEHNAILAAITSQREAKSQEKSDG